MHMWSDPKVSTSLLVQTKVYTKSYGAENQHYNIFFYVY